jgi:hypothetical protein
VLADYALIDQHGKLSVLGIFQHVWVASFPAVHPRTHLVIRVRGKRTEIGTHPMRIRFVDAGGRELIGGEGTVQFGELGGRGGRGGGRGAGVRRALPRPGPYARDHAGRRVGGAVDRGVAQQQ